MSQEGRVERAKTIFRVGKLNDWKFLQWKEGWVIIADLAIIVVVIKNM